MFVLYQIKAALSLRNTTTMFGVDRLICKRHRKITRIYTTDNITTVN
ncbi:hypothetical protein [Priestia koreensis]